MPHTRFRVAICGGGIGGVTLALVLGKYAGEDIQVDIYDAKAGFAEIGAGISLWKRTWFIMKVLGLDEAIGGVAVSPPVESSRKQAELLVYLGILSSLLRHKIVEPSFALKKSDTSEPTNIFFRMINPYGTIAVHRADFLKILVDRLPRTSSVYFSKRLAYFTQEEKEDTITLHFSDGSTASADLLIGADGVKSVTRQTLYKNLSIEATERGNNSEAQRLEHFIHARWSGTYIYRSLVETEKLLKIAPGHPSASIPMIYLGKDKHVVSYPISRGKLINFGTFISEVEREGELPEGPTVFEVSSEETIVPFASWEPEVNALLKCVDKYSRWAVCQIRKLPHCVSGRIALLGDSAHAMTTHLGAGAGQAIEDAFVLGQLLADPSTTKSNLNEILCIYEDVRLPLAHAFVENSRLTGLTYEFNYTPETVLDAAVDPESPEGLKLLSDFISKQWACHWEDMPDKDWERAKDRLDRLVKSQPPIHK